MQYLTMSNIHKLMLVSVLTVSGLGLSACSSSEEDAEVREEPTQHIDAQEPVEQSAINTTDDTAVVTTDDAHAGMVHDDANMDMVHDDANMDMANNDNIGVATAEDNMGEGSVDVGTQNNPDMLDGTDKEEHVSTY